MAKKKTKQLPNKYTVLIPCSNDATGKEYKVGDTVTLNDFTTAVILNWCDIEPPVLKSVGGE